MPILKMQTDVVRNMSVAFQTMAEFLLAEVQTVEGHSEHLLNSWSAPGADVYASETFPALIQIKKSTQALLFLAHQLRYEAEEWEYTDATFGGDAVPVPSSSPTNMENKESFISGVKNSIVEGTTNILNKGVDVLKDVGENVAEKVLTQTDNLALGFFNDLLPQTAPGSEESIKFELDKGATVNGIKLETGSEVEIIRNPDGTYNVIVGNSAGLGVDYSDPTIKATLGDKEVGKDGKNKMEATQTVASYMSFKFDPNNPGDMTEMGVLLGSFAATNLPGMPPGLSQMAAPLSTGGTLFNNIDAVKFETTTEGDLNFNNIAKIVDLDVEFEGSLGAGGELRKNDNGQWEVAASADASIGGKIKLDDIAVGGKAEMTIEQITNLETKSNSTMIKLELDANSDIDLAKSLNIPVSVSADGKIIVEYTLTEPYDTLKNVIMTPDGKPNFEALAANSEIQVSVATESQSEASIEVGAKGYGAEGGITQTRTSESVIYKQP